MSKFISKFRQLQARTLSRECCYENLRVTKFGWDATICAVNPKFVAIIVESVGGGSFVVTPCARVGPLPMDYPTVSGHGGWVLDIAWSPHNDNIIASGSTDGVARVWAIPDAGLSEPLERAVVDLKFHKGRCCLVLWHPSALNVLVTGGSDNQLAIWNVGTGQVLKLLDAHPALVYSACFNWNGSQLVTSCRDTMLRVLEPRTGQLLGSAVCHEGARPTRVIVLRQGLIFTTGYSRSMQRQYSLRSLQQLEPPLALVDVDSQIGLLFPIYDADTSLLFLCGRGDNILRCYEVTDKPPFLHYINTIASKESQRGVCLMPKRGCNLPNGELGKIFRLNSKGVCEIMSLTMPNELPEQLFAATPAITAVEWFSGQNAEPKMCAPKANTGTSPKALLPPEAKEQQERQEQQAQEQLLDSEEQDLVAHALWSRRQLLLAKKKLLEVKNKTWFQDPCIRKRVTLKVSMPCDTPDGPLITSLGATQGEEQAAVAEVPVEENQ
ncbi:coronin-6-like [Drosophila subobscura]|uniref:coronin-6-like n=1 Tax=Drosophila subobscura TaxID=7241 RepID=UPI00155B03C2|nr:coronin-6-like [Drosophila subobscura]